MIAKYEHTIACDVCKGVIGKMYEVEDEKRPGFFSNVTRPDPLPTECPTCKKSEGALVRAQVNKRPKRILISNLEG